MAQVEQPPFIDELRSRISRMLDGLDPESAIAATVVFKVDRKKESEFARNAQELTEATRKMPGCQSFAFHKAIGDGSSSEPVEYIINESWESVRLFKAQWESEHLKKFQQSVMDLVTELPDLRFYQDPGYATGGRAVLPKTGQRDCWDTRGDLVKCAGSGQDGEYQAGEAWPVPRFVDNQDGTVTDKLTDLIWLKNADHFGPVTWDQALENARNLASGSKGLKDGSRAGDWRLANIRELESLIDFGSGNPILPKGHPFTNVTQTIYWASTTLASAPTLAWMITLGIGPTVFDLKTSDNRMWPVRGNSRVAKTGQKVCWDSQGNTVDCAGSGQDGDLQAGVAPPNPRFVDNRDGTVTDRLTDLVWLKNADAFGLRTWEQGLAVCKSLGHGSAGVWDGSQPGDWRLPNAKEIESLVDYGNFGPSLPKDHPFINVQPSSYWTSTSVTLAPTEAMFIILGVGPTIFENKEHPFFIWPVRNRRSR